MTQQIKLTERQTGDLQCDGWEGPCDSKNAVSYHMRTRYVDNTSNYATLCPSCQEASDTHWDDMWREYYASIL